MRRYWFGIVGSLLVLAGWFAVWSQVAVPVAESQSPLTLITPTPLPVSPQNERRANPRIPAISFIDSNTAMCYRPVAETGACYIGWSYLSVTASTSQYVISMTVSIDGNLRAYHAGFFQTSMYIPGAMYGDGFRVSCGGSGAGGILGLGNTYNYTIRAMETGGLSAANYGSVTCPADTIRLFLPGILRY